MKQENEKDITNKQKTLVITLHWHFSWQLALHTFRFDGRMTLNHKSLRHVNGWMSKVKIHKKFAPNCSFCLIMSKNLICSPSADKENMQPHKGSTPSLRTSLTHTENKHKLNTWICLGHSIPVYRPKFIIYLNNSNSAASSFKKTLTIPNWNQP